MRREEVLVAVCAALSTRNDGEAVSLLHSHYRFAPAAPTKHNAGPLQSTRVFIRDGFIDRYSGDRLIFPPVLRLISLALPADFPYHPNWKTTETHPAFWEVGATVDHVDPRCLGGSSDDSNLVTTSMARNSAKMNWPAHGQGQRNSAVAQGGRAAVAWPLTGASRGRLPPFQAIMVCERSRFEELLWPAARRR